MTKSPLSSNQHPSKGKKKTSYQHLELVATLSAMLVVLILASPVTSLAQETNQPSEPKTETQPQKSWLQRLRERFNRPSNPDSSVGGQLADELNFNPAFTPPGDKAPKSTENASSRDALRCNLTEPLTRAVMPAGNYGLTLDSYPSIFVEAPQLSAERVVLAFKSESGDDYYQTILPVPPLHSGKHNRKILRFQLPKSSQPIAPGKNYRWSLAFICGDYLEPSDPMLSGWIQRAELPAESIQIFNQLPKLEQGRWLSERGYWYDAVQIADELLQAVPSNRD